MYNIILTTVPTGLGHIRVTKALILGLPIGTPTKILGIRDETTSLFYRIISTNFYLRKTLEFIQTNPIAEKNVNSLMTFIQEHNTKEARKELQRIIDSNPDYPTIIISTHAFIAHKIQKIINTQKFKRPVLHAVIVTDDSPQRFWMINSDLLFVPSHNTKNVFLKLYKSDNHKPPQIEVVPYPISPQFCRQLSPQVLYNKIEQLDPENPQKARICIPVSGAAVQLEYYKVLIEELLCDETKKECNEFNFSVVTREGNYTKSFIEYFRDTPGISFHIGANDEQTVELYDELYYQLNPPSLEITKPSEQSFKVLTSPETIGGPIMLLTEPVGRQEYDNLNFLERHGFIPSETTTKTLLQAIENNNTHLLLTYKSYASSWRGLRLPTDPYQATNFIIGCHKHGIFASMQNYKNYKTTEYLSPNGVAAIWNKIFSTTKTKFSV
jgi:hypothetical protein